MRLYRLAAELHCNPEYTTKVYDNHSCACAHLCIPLTGQANLQANLQDKVDTLQDNLQDKVDTLQANLQDKVETLQDKVDTVQHHIVNLEDKLDTLQNTTEASTRKNHHEVVELLHNTSCSLDGKN